MKTHPLVIGAALFCLAAPLRAQTNLMTFRGAAKNRCLGFSTRSIKDLDGDGAPDFIVGEPGNFYPGTSLPGSAYVYSGRDGTLLRTFVGDNPEDTFGGCVADAGDVDHDGLHDVIVGAMQYTADRVTGLGYARVFSGKDGSTLWTFNGTALNDGFGSNVSAAGDVDADGFADLLVGAIFADAGSVTDAGAIYVYSGKTGAALFSFTGTQKDQFVGNAISALGDVNADGHDEFIVGAFNESANGIQPGVVRVFSGKDFSILYQLTGEIDELEFGVAADGGGDVTGDGVADFVIGANGVDNGFEPGRAYVYSGADGSIVRVHSGLSAEDAFGWVVAGSPDMNHDGFADVAVGAPYTTYEGTMVGAVYVFSGKDGSLLFSEFGSKSSSDPVYGSSMGWDVAGIGDVNEDGQDELLVGAPFDSKSKSDQGAVFMFTSRDCHASWQNYGAGWPGTLGVPDFTLSDPPVLGATLTIDLEDSRGADTFALLTIGFGRAAIPTSAGGTLLVSPPWLTLPLSVPAAGLGLTASVPSDTTLCGVVVDLQCLEVDPGATRNLAFTEGLEFTFGGE